MPLQDITITASINSIATQSYGQRTYQASSDLESFPIETITGSHGESWPDFKTRNVDSINSASNTTVNLIVNVTQSWTGSNITPLGPVLFTHDTMEEFFNGEFSGSNYFVTNGNSLIDEDCEQFLEVNTTSVDYSIFPYPSLRDYSTGVVYSTLLTTFLDRNTAPLPGQALVHIDEKIDFTQSPDLYYRTINWLKIARVDQQGNDNTLSLQELTSFRWTDSFRGEITLIVQNIAEYSTYYLYEVISQTWVDISTFALADGAILDYYFTGSTNLTSAPAGTTYLTYSPYTIGNGATLQSNGYYVPSLTPNLEIKYTASLTVTNNNIGTSVSFSYNVVETLDFIGYSILSTTSSGVIAPSVSKTITISGSGYGEFIGSSFYFTEIKNANLPVSISNATWHITQSFVPYLPTSSTVIEPYLLSNFVNSDCDVLINNAFDNEESEYVRRVLYSDGGSIPSNFDQIVSGTAEFADVNDYLYASQASVSSRYIGSRTTSNNINEPCTIGFDSTTLSQYGQTAISPVNPNNVSLTTTYMAYFDSVKNVYPILKNAISPRIKYLIREDGKTFVPGADEEAYYNTYFSFPQGNNVVVSLLNNANSTPLLTNTQSVLLSGFSYIPITYNLSTSTPLFAGFTSSITFTNQLVGPVNNVASPPSYSLRVSDQAGVNSFSNTPFFAYPQNIQIANQQIGSGLFQARRGPTSGDSDNYYRIFYDTSGGWYGDRNDGQYVSASAQTDNCNVTGFWFSSGSALVNIRVKIAAMQIPSTWTWRLNTFIWKVNWDGVSVVGSSDTGSIITSSASQIYTGPVIGSSTSPGQIIDLNYDYFCDPDDFIFVTCTFDKIANWPLNGNSFSPNTSLAPYNYSFQIGLSGINYPKVEAPFFTTGSNSRNILTSSADFGRILAAGTYRQDDIEGSGFDPIIVNTNLRPGDEVRFGYDEFFTYKIEDVAYSTSGSGQTIGYITLDRNILSSSLVDINDFTFRRKIKDNLTGLALLSTPLNEEQDGVILPQYPSNLLKQNISSILNKLTSEAAI